MKIRFTNLVSIVMLSLLGITTAFAQSLSGNYTIDANSSASNNYRSVALAASALASNGVSGPVTFTISDGTYSGQVNFGAISGTSSTNTITFVSKSEDSSKVIITNTGTYTLYYTGGDYITFKDVTIQSTNTGTRYIVYMAGASNYNNFIECEIKGVRNTSTSYSVYLASSNYNVFDNCLVTGNYYAMYFAGSSSVPHVSNVVKNCKIRHYYYYGIYSQYADYFKMLNCVVDSAQTGIGYAVYDNYGKGNHIIGNEVSTGYYGFMMYYENYNRGTIASTDTFRFHNNMGSNVMYYPGYFYYCDYMTVYHNAFEATGSYYAMYFYGASQNQIRFANNILANHGGSYGFYMYLGGASYLPLYWDYNDYYLNNNTYFGVFNGTAYTTFAAMQAANSRRFDQNSVTIDPDFAGNGDLRTYAPGLNNIGVDFTSTPWVDTDIDGNTRPNSLDGKVDIGPNDFYLSDYDLDVFGLISPLSVDLTSNKVTAEFRNAGSRTISNATVEVQYSTDSGSTWVTENLSISSLDPGKTMKFEFNTLWRPTRSGKFRLSIKISKSVTGDPDMLDQMDFDICSGISGTFTIGRWGADYPSFTAAIRDLACGVAGPVVFEVQGGTYTENLVINTILGASATNTVTFHSPHRDSVTLRSTGGNVITFNGADHVAFENMKLRMDGSTGFTVSLYNRADYNRIENCHIYNNISVTNTDANPVCISSSPTSYSSSGQDGWYNVFKDNDIEGGYFGVTIYATTNLPSRGNQFLNNNFKNQYYYGVYLYFTDSLVFHDNHIDDFRYQYNYGMMLYYASNFDVQRNYSKTVYGDYLAYANYYNYNGTTRSIFANNMLISTGTSYNIYGYYMTYTNFWHNSLYGKGSYMCYWYYIQNNDIRNNIFYYEGSSYCLYMYNPTFIEWDYNDYVIKSGNLAYITGATYSNVSALRGYNSSYNQNNWALDPQWVDKTDDLHITSGFPDMFGALVGVEEDFDSDSRCTFAPAVGADEFNSVTLPPVANFLVPDTAWLNSPTSILNANKPSATSRARWYVNGNLTSDSLHLVYTPSAPGTDTVLLIMENCGGIDSLEQTVFVSQAVRAPKVDFTVSKNVAYTGEYIQLKDLSTNGPTVWKWKITPPVYYNSFLQFLDRTHVYNINADSTTASPVLYFNQAGMYEVCLVVENSRGADSVCKVDYIVVRENFMACQIPNFTEATAGTLYDDGGKDGSYSAGLNGFNTCINRITTCEGTIDFNVTDFELAGGDYLRIYDGQDNRGRPLWDATNYPSGMTGEMNDASVVTQFTATTGSAYIEFETDANTTTTGPGFAINWEVNRLTFTAPMADINLPDTACVGFPVYFENATSGISSSVEWDVLDDGKVEGYADVQAYTFTSAGTYDVKLRAFSFCADSDSITKQIVIIDAAKAPTPGITVDKTLVNVGDTVTIMDASQYCASGTRWEIMPANYIVLNKGTMMDDNISVMFTRKGYYSIKQVKTNTFGSDSLTLTNHIQVLNYCEPYALSTDDDVAINRVMFNDIDHSSGVAEGGYSNFTNVTTTVEKGITYGITIERMSNNSQMSRKVWIDYNIDGEFDASELVLHETPSTSMSYTDSISVPTTAGTGFTRMRVAVSYRNQANVACGPHQLGEFEDYGIILSDDDLTAPYINLFGATVDTIEVFDTWTEPGFRAMDLKDGNLTASVTTSSTLDASTVGEYMITYDVKDAAGNAAPTKSRTIYVVDRTAPTISLLGDDSVYVEIYETYTEAGVSTSDNYDAVLNVVTTSNLDVNSLGTYTIQYCVTDANGNGPVCVSRTVVVGDTITPVLALNGDDKVTVDVYTNYIDAGYTYNDNDSANVMITYSGTWSGAPDLLGDFTLIITAEDQAGNTATVTREITVVDRVAPTIKLEGMAYVKVKRWSDYADSMYIINDNYYDESELTVEVGGNYESTQSAGIYYITYKVSDPSGNSSSEVTRIIEVEQPDPNSISELSGMNVSIYPNPSNGQFRLELALPSSQMLNVSLVNAMGQEVAAIFNGQTDELNQSVEVSHLPGGLYFLRINNGTAQKLERITITK